MRKERVSQDRRREAVGTEESSSQLGPEERGSQIDREEEGGRTGGAGDEIAWGAGSAWWRMAP